MKLSLHFASFVTIAAGTLLVSSPAHAQQVTQSTTTTSAPAAPPPQTSTTTTTSAPVFVQPTTQREEVRQENTGPDGTLLVSGLFVFGIPYVFSLGVATESSHDGDHHLFVPLAGPWLDMANRGSCPSGSNACDNETTNKVLLGVDGIFQAIGALEVASAFLFPTTREVTTVPATAFTPKMTLTPMKVGGTGYGIGALARF